MNSELVSMDTTIRLSSDTRDKLVALGKKGESYDTLIARLIEHYKKSLPK
jgi:predicted DNA-binding protein